MAAKWNVNLHGLIHVYPLCESHKDVLAINHLVGSNVLSGMSAEDYSTNIAECMTHPLQWRVSVITYPGYYCLGRYVRYQLIHLLKIFTNSILNLVWMILLLYYKFIISTESCNIYTNLDEYCGCCWLLFCWTTYGILQLNECLSTKSRNILWLGSIHWFYENYYQGYYRLSADRNRFALV